MENEAAFRGLQILADKQAKAFSDLEEYKFKFYTHLSLILTTLLGLFLTLGEGENIHLASKYVYVGSTALLAFCILCCVIALYGSLYFLDKVNQMKAEILKLYIRQGGTMGKQAEHIQKPRAYKIS